MKFLLTALCSLIFILSVYGQDTIHNIIIHDDHKNKRPLFDALDYGVKGINIPINYHKGEIYVGNKTPFFNKKRKTLDYLYLNPLRQILVVYDNQIYEQHSEPFYVVLRYEGEKDSTESLIKTLNQRLNAYNKYQKIITEKVNFEIHERPIVICLITGDEQKITTSFSFLDKLQRTYCFGLNALPCQPILHIHNYRLATD